MFGLNHSFDNIEHLAAARNCDILRGYRSGQPWLIRVIHRRQNRRQLAELELALATSRHALLLSGEVVTKDDVTAVATETDGQLLLETRSEASSDPRKLVELGFALARAAQRGASSDPPYDFGMPSPHDIVVASDGLWVLPGAGSPSCTADFLKYSPHDLWFVDRDTLRGAPSAEGCAFNIGAILLWLSDAEALPEYGSDAADFIQRAVLVGHPLCSVSRPDGSLGDIIRDATTPHTPIGVANLLSRLRQLKSELDPLNRARKLANAGEGLRAVALLHQTARKDQSCLKTLSLKAELECKLGQPERALRTLRAAQKLAPCSRTILVRIFQLSESHEERLAILNEILVIDPLDVELRMQRARILVRLGQTVTALANYRSVGAIAATDPRHHFASTLATIEVGWLGVASGNNIMALAAVEDGYNDRDLQPPSLRAEVLGLHGHTLHRMYRFQEAAHKLEEAVELDRQYRSSGPQLQRLNDLIYALVAIGSRVRAASLAGESLLRDPSQEKLVKLLAALGEQ